jgi:hypothetical protein
MPHSSYGINVAERFDRTRGNVRIPSLRRWKPRSGFPRSLPEDRCQIVEYLKNTNAEANLELLRLALMLAEAGKATVMATLITWQTVNAARKPGRGQKQGKPTRDTGTCAISRKPNQELLSSHYAVWHFASIVWNEGSPTKKPDSLRNER